MRPDHVGEILLNGAARAMIESAPTSPESTWVSWLLVKLTTAIPAFRMLSLAPCSSSTVGVSSKRAVQRRRGRASPAVAHLSGCRTRRLLRRSAGETLFWRSACKMLAPCDRRVLSTSRPRHAAWSTSCVMRLYNPEELCPGLLPGSRVVFAIESRVLRLCTAMSGLQST